MFRSRAHSFRLWWEEFSADILGADLPPTSDLDLQQPHPPAPAPSALAEHHRRHPHRARLQPRRLRREGAVPGATQHCLCPVRASATRPGEATLSR